MKVFSGWKRADGGGVSPAIFHAESEGHVPSEFTDEFGGGQEGRLLGWSFLGAPASFNIMIALWGHISSQFRAIRGGWLVGICLF